MIGSFDAKVSLHCFFINGDLNYNEIFWFVKTFFIISTGLLFSFQFVLCTDIYYSVCVSPSMFQIFLIVKVLETLFSKES